MDEDQPEDSSSKTSWRGRLHDHLRKRYSRRNVLKGAAATGAFAAAGPVFRAPGLSYAAGKQVRGAASHPDRAADQDHPHCERAGRAPHSGQPQHAARRFCGSASAAPARRRDATGPVRRLHDPAGRPPGEQLSVPSRSPRTVPGSPRSRDSQDGDQLHPLRRRSSSATPSSAGTARRDSCARPSGMLAEVAEGWPSAVTGNGGPVGKLGPEEIRERMSGNLCRCAAYPNIVAAITDVSGKGGAAL